jgi:putative mRNA 3-end processing factor
MRARGGGAGADLIRAAPDGLLCEPGGFHIDPWRPVERAVITHAHGDHFCAGCGSYLCSPETAALLRVRLGEDASIEALAYGESLRLGETAVSLHPAGHILGSAQVRVRRDAPRSQSRSRRHGTHETWVVTGDYKIAPDPTCREYEPVRADVLLTESTFGLPIYRWPPEAEVREQINAWWRENREAGRTSVILAYALGKAQRVLAGLDASIGPIGVHGAVVKLNDVYRANGAPLPRTVHANEETAAELRGAGLIVAPPSVLRSRWMRRFTGREGVRTAMASGWMRVRGRRRWLSVDRGFVLSDHADFDALVRAVRESGAERVGVTHGYAEPFARWLAEREGVESFTVPTRYTGELDEEEAGPYAPEEAGEREADGSAS